MINISKFTCKILLRILLKIAMLINTENYLIKVIDHN